MDTIEEYFKEHTDKVSFIELKDNKRLNVEGYEINDDIPLPVLTDDLVKEIKEGNLEEEIDMSNIIDGIIFILGIDNKFKYLKEYKNILLSYSENIEEYIFYKGIRYIEDGKNDLGAIYFRALKIVNPKNTNNIFNYALSLENIAKSFFAKEEDEKGLEVIKRATMELESILDIDGSYPLAYYKLGYHYKFNQQYLKAKLIWNKYLLLDDDDLRLQEIRTEIDNIENDVNFEAGLTYITKGDYEKAINEFLKLLPKLEKWWELNYFLGISYKGLGEYNKAIEYFLIALEENKDLPEIYNELGISYISIGSVEEAIEVFDQAIEKIKDDYKLFFNRGIAYLQLNQINKAYEDISKAVEINPKDKNMILQKQKLEEIL